MHLTPEIAEAAYAYLRATPPFRGWKLPPADEVKFRVLKTPHEYGSHSVQPAGHEIAISIGRIEHTTTLLQTMAHEMIHVHQRERGLPWGHGENFVKLWARVAKAHGFDPRSR